MFDNETTKPLLVEPGIKYFLHESLKKCSEYKDKYKKNRTCFIPVFFN